MYSFVSLIVSHQAITHFLDITQAPGPVRLISCPCDVNENAPPSRLEDNSTPFFVLGRYLFQDQGPVVGDAGLGVGRSKPLPALNFWATSATIQPLANSIFVSTQDAASHLNGPRKMFQLLQFLELQLPCPLSPEMEGPSGVNVLLFPTVLPSFTDHC